MPTQAPKEMHGGPTDTAPEEPSQMTRLEQMRERLAALGDEARSIRSQMPREFEPDVERIQQQMQRLGERLSELSGGFVYQAALPKPGPRSQAQPAHTGAGTQPQTMPRTGSDDGMHVSRAAPDEVIVLGGPAKADNPWSEESARALTRFYESGEAFFGYAREIAQAAHHAAQPQASAQQSAPIQGRELYSAEAQSEPHHEQATGIDTGWLDQRLSEIAIRIEQSLAEMHPGNSLLTLGRRFDQLEARMTSALGNMATRADLKELRLAEAQIEEISTQLDQLRRQFARLDAIDAHLGTLAAQLSDERLTRLIASGVASTRDTSRLEQMGAQLATIAGQLSHDRLADLISQNAVRGSELEEMATTAAQKAAARFADREERETHSRGLDEVRVLIENLINERRHNDENNASMLETMQQAIIRVLDRIDTLELGQQEAAGTQQATYAPVPMQPEEATSVASVQAYEQAEPQDDPGYAPQPQPYTPASQGMFTSPAPHPQSQPEAPQSQGMFTSPPFDLDAAFATDRDSAPSHYVMPDPTTQPVDALRHDFIADAHRAKLKAAAKVDTKLDPNLGRTADMAPERPAVQKPRKRRGIFRSPRVLMSILTILAMIPAALFFMPRTPQDHALPAAADLVMPTVDEAPAATAPGMPRVNGTAAPQDGEDSKPPVDAAPAAPPPPAKQSQRLIPDTEPGAPVFEDAGAPAPDPKAHAFNGAALSPAASSSEEARLAFLQDGELKAAPKPTPAALMEQHVIGTGTLKAGDTALGTAPRLPPATVGPYSLRLSAAKGDAAAQFEVAARLAQGRGTDKDIKEAAEWYQRSAASGFAMSQFRLGTLYERGAGVPKDLARAKIWYGRAAEQGNVKAMHNLAVMMISHGGTKPDYETAVKWFSQAAAYGLADSQYNLAMLYENGLGVTKDEGTAYKWLILAANSGDKEAKKHRDGVKAKLSATEADEAAAEAGTWQAKRSNPIANDANVAGQAWLRPRTNNG